MSSFEGAAAAAIALAVLSGCCVLGRFLSRIIVVKHVGAEDFLIAFAWMAAVAMAVVARRPQFTFDGDDSPETMLMRETWAANITYNLAVFLLKDSLLFQYLRFSTDTGYRRGCWTLGSIVTAYGISALFVGIFSCHPTAFVWDHQIQGGKCIDFLAFWLFNAAFNSITAIIVLILPIPVLKALQLPREQGWILIGIFGLGIFVCIASIIRLVSVCTATLQHENNASITIWSAVEINVGIICACLPSFRHPITQVMPRIMAAHYRLSYTSPPLTPMSIDLEQKQPKTSVKAFSRTGSLKSEASSLHPSAIIDLYTHGTNKSTDDLTRDTSIPAVLRAGVPLTITVPSMENSDLTDPAQSLPRPPTLPAPVARPNGPRVQRPIKLHTTRSHRHRNEPLYREPLACIPESQSQTSTPDPERTGRRVTRMPPYSPSPSIQAQPWLGTTSSGLVVPPTPMSPSTYSTITMSSTSSESGSSSSSASSSASSPASPSPEAEAETQREAEAEVEAAETRSRTCSYFDTAAAPPHHTKQKSSYTYEILGGPRAMLGQKSPNTNTNTNTTKSKFSFSKSLSPSPASKPKGPAAALSSTEDDPSSASSSPMSRRERARREKERTKRKERDAELQQERRDAQRPLGPRDMRRAVSWEGEDQERS